MKKSYLFSSVIGIFTFLLPLISIAQCTYQLRLEDTFGDGWNGNTIDVKIGTVTTNYTLDDLFDTTINLAVTVGDSVVLDYLAGGAFNGEVSFTLFDGNLNSIYTSGLGPATAVAYADTASCPSCIYPTSLFANNISTDSADLNWTENNGATTWIIEYGPANFTQGNGTDTLITSNPFTLDSLDPFTTYDFYVRSICGVGDTSIWSPVQSFRTLFGCPAGAACATYNGGAIPSDDAFTALPGTSSCPETLSVTIPAGNRVDSMSTFYDMTAYLAPNNAWMSEQRTWLYSPTTLAGEAALSVGAGNAAGTFSYERRGLTFVKNAIGTLDVEMHAGRTFGGTGCDTVTNSIDNNSWNIIVYYSPIPSCPEPISLTTGNVTLNSAELSWTEIGPATQWEVEYDTANFTFGSGTRAVANSNPFQINGLNPGTAYSYYVRSLCGVGDTGIWEGPFTFITAYGIPFEQTFENFPTDIEQNPWPEGWTSSTSDDPNWISYNDANGTVFRSGGTGPSVDHTLGTINGTFIFMETSGGTTGNTADFISPPIYIDSANQSVELSYWYFNYGANIDRMEVIIDTNLLDTNNTEEIVKTYFGQQQFAQTDDWLKDSVILTGYAGKSVNIIFRGYNVACCSGDIAIDDVRLDTIPKVNTAVTSIVSPSGALCPGTINPTVSISNNGLDTITTVDVTVDINGVTTTITSNRTIPTGDSIHVTFPSTAISSGLFYDINFYTTDPNGQADEVLNNDTLGIENLTTGLAGNITIDTSMAISPSNFHTFSGLANQLNLVGVCGDVIVDVAAATYDDVFALSEVPGLSDTSRLTVDGSDSSLVYLENDLANDGAIISFDGVSYVTIKNMTLRSTNTGTADHFGVHFTSASNYDSIVNCRILMDPTNDFGAFGIGASASITDDFAEGNNANYVTVINSAIDGGSYSIHFEGPATGNYNLGNSFINNTLSNMDDYGIYTDQQDSVIVNGNTINGIRSTTGDGIACFDAMNFEVNANQVSVDDYGIYLSNANFNEFADREATLINNMVLSTADHGIYLTNPIRVNIFHNTVYSEGSVAAIYLNGISFIDSLDIRNNIFASLSSLAFEMQGAADTTAFLKFDNNVFYTGGSGDLLDIDLTAYASLSAYQTARPGFNINSLEGNPQFISTTDLHIVGSFIDETGDNGVNVLVDIDGDTRPSPLATFVDAGADEYIPPPCATPSNVKAFNPGLDSVTIVLNGTSLDYEYEFLSGTQTQGNGLIGIINADSVRVGGLTSSTSYRLFMRQVCRRGDTSPWVGPVFFSTAYGIPYQQDFENFNSDIEQNPWPEGWSSSTATDPNWISYNDANGTVFRSGGTGPLVDHTLGTINGTFVFMETSGGTTGDSADFVSPPIYVNDTLSTIELKYWYYNFGADIDRMEVLVDTNGVEELVATYTGQQQTSQNDSWLQGKHLLSGYQGKSIQIIVRGFNVPCCAGDLAIDDIEIVIPSAVNGEVAEITRPSSGCGLGSSDSVEVVLVNAGTDTLSNFSVSYSLDGAAAVTETFSGIILSGDTANYTFSTPVNLSTAGTYSLVTYTTITGDSDTSNDTASVNIDNIPIISGYPYVQSFENGNGGWTSGGANSTWELGVPANTIIDTASDGTEAWVTNLTGTYANSESSWVQSPCFDFSGLTVPLIELDIWWNSEFSWDGAVLQSSIDGGSTWQKVGDFQDTVNWYNDATILGLNTLEPSQEGWTGRNSSTNGSNGWLTAKHNLDGLGGISGVILRVVFGSDGTVNDEGFAFDNVFITDSLPTFDGSISDLNSPIASPDSCYSVTEDVILTLLNAGNTPIDFTTDSAEIAVNVSGAITQTLNFTVNDNSLNGGNPLLGGNSIELNVGTINLTAGGSYNFESIISIAADTLNANDTLYDTLQINQVSGGMLSGVDTICSGDSTTLTTMNYQGELQWQELISGVWTDIAGETNATYIAKPTNTTDYRVMACISAASDTLTVVSVNLTTGPNAVGDTTVVACGNPGTAIATASSTNTNSSFVWYNEQTGGSLVDTSLSNYSLNAAGDQMSFIVDTTIVNNSTSDTLWVSEIVSTGSIQCESTRSFAIVMVDCITGIENNTLNKDQLNIYPNPSTGLFKLSIISPKLSNYKLEIRDLSGKIVYNNNLTVNGKYTENIDLTHLSKGVYFLQSSTTKGVDVKKIIIQ